VLSNPANLGWWIGIWLALLSLMRLPRQSGRVALLAFGGALAVLSTPVASVGAPLWLLRAWRAARRRDFSELAFVVTLVAALVFCFLVTRSLGANVMGKTQLSFFDSPRGYLERYGALAADRVPALLLAPRALAVVRTAGSGAVAGMAIAVWAALLAFSLPARGRTLPGLVATLYLFLASLLLSTLGRLIWAVLPLSSFPARYTILPGAMLVLALTIAVDGVPRGALRTAAVLGVAALLVWSWTPRFVTSPFADRHWPQYAALLDQKLRAGSTSPLTIPINPPWSPIEFDTRPLEPAQAVPATQPVAVLAGDTTFRQTFVSTCDGLDGIVLRLAAETPSSRGTLELRLVDEQRQQTVASVAVPRGQLLEDAPQPFFFTPVAGSAGVRYSIVLRATELDPAAPVSVLGAAHDPYPDGQAIFPGAPSDLDASFAYSCAPSQTEPRR